MKMIGLLAISVFSLANLSQAEDVVVPSESELAVVMDCLDVSGERTEEALAKALRIIGKTDFESKIELTMTKDEKVLGVFTAQGNLIDGPLNLTFGENAEYVLTSEGRLTDFIVPAVLTGPQGQTNLVCAAQ